MKKLFLLLSAIVFTLALSGCGDSGKPAAPSGSGTSAKTTLKVGATPVPHAEILEIIKPLLAKQNIELTIVEFSDYVQPNLALNDQLPDRKSVV